MLLRFLPWLLVVAYIFLIAPGDIAAADVCSQRGPNPPRDAYYSVLVGSVQRTYKMHVPTGYKKTKTPMVLNFHGRSFLPDDQERTSDMNGVADRNKFLVVYPQGLKTPEPPTGVYLTGWNSGDYAPGTDDIAFVSALIPDVASRVCLDTKRVYATGMSNGAMFTYRVGCELSDKIAAIAPVSGVATIDCDPSSMKRAVPIVHFHNSGDTYTPFFGGGLNPFTNQPFRSVGTSLSPYVVKAGCQNNAWSQVYANGDSRCYTVNFCSVEVKLCLVDAAAHSWPGSPTSGPAGTISYASPYLKASEVMWALFSQYSLP